MKFNRGNYTDVISHFNDDAMQYCLDVLEGRILAGKLIKLACLRHLNDLKRINEDDKFIYTYSTKKAQGMINFAELVPDVNSNKCLPLASFQKFIYSMLIGWENPQLHGARFKNTYLSMARTNGKTQMAAVLALRDFLLGMPASSREIVVASNTNEQVTKLYRYVRKAWHALAKTKYFKGISDQVIDNSDEFRIDSSNSRLVHRSAVDAIGGDAMHPSNFIFDEYHLQTSTDYIDSFSSGNVQNPLARIIIISTAGTDPRVPMREDYSAYSEQIEKGNLDDSILFLCWEQDADDEAFKQDTWIKSNPLLEVKSISDSLMAGLTHEREVQASKGSLPKFLVKNMNRWQNAKKNAYIPLDCIEKSIIDYHFDITGREVYFGYDASLSNDDTTLTGLFPFVDKQGNKKFYIWQHSFIPTRKAGGIEAKSKQDAINYQAAEKAGYCDITKNRFGTVDQSNVYRYMLELVDKYKLKVKAFGFDSWGTGEFVRALNEYKKDEWLLFPIRQGAHSLSEATKWVQDSFNEGGFIMDNDPILKAALSNAVLTDKDNQLLIDKNMNSAKIDAVDALIDAAYQGMLHFTDFTNEDNKDKSPFSGMSNDEINEHFKKNFSF